MFREAITSVSYLMSVLLNDQDSSPNYNCKSRITYTGKETPLTSTYEENIQR